MQCSDTSVYYQKKTRMKSYEWLIFQSCDPLSDPNMLTFCTLVKYQQNHAVTFLKTRRLNRKCSIQ